MRNLIIACSVVCAALNPLSADAFIVEVSATATGNIPSREVDQRSYRSPVDWVAAGQAVSTRAHAGKDDWDPPFTESDATALFDQSDPTNAVLRAKDVARRAYGGRYHNYVGASSTFGLDYSLKIENLTATAVNVNFGNSLHGLFAVVAGGFSGAPVEAWAKETVAISDLTVVGGRSGSVAVDWLGATSTDLWASFVHPARLHDDFYGDVDGFELNSPIEYYGSRLVAGGASVVSSVDYDLELAAVLWSQDGLALVDFSNTAYLKVTATDPITGADRSADIRVTLLDGLAPSGVPEPSALALVLAVLPGLRLLRQRPLPKIA